VNLYFYTKLNDQLMTLMNLPLVNWSNGVIMIAIFAGVCIALVGIVLSFINTDKKKQE
tara:strand:+ start:555 stop:728 length:174 start_codon:yes stop_codon:yes gene_type:complete